MFSFGFTGEEVVDLTHLTYFIQQHPVVLMVSLLAEIFIDITHNHPEDKGGACS